MSLARCGFFSALMSVLWFCRSQGELAHGAGAGVECRGERDQGGGLCVVSPLPTLCSSFFVLCSVCTRAVLHWVFLALARIALLVCSLCFSRAQLPAWTASPLRAALPHPWSVPFLRCDFFFLINLLNFFFFEYSWFNVVLVLSVREGNDNPLQYSFLEKSLDRGAWWATVLGVAWSRTPLSDWTHTHTIVSGVQQSKCYPYTDVHPFLDSFST